LFTIPFDLHCARSPFGQNIKRFRRIILLYDYVPEFIVLFLQERLNRGEMFIGKKTENR
jgi:hypothetical protein